MKPQLTKTVAGSSFAVNNVEDLGYCKRITTELEGKPFIIIANNEEYTEKWQ